MALTQAQWLSKLQGLLPAWWFDLPQNQQAVLNGIAAVFAEVDQEKDNYFAQTMIGQSNGAILDEHAAERSLTRQTGELDPSLRYRTVNIVNQTAAAQIKALVDSLLVIGPCTVKEDYKDVAYASRGNFLNRHELLTAYHNDMLTIVTPPQQHVPYSFLSRKNFCSRQNFAGSTATATAIYNAVIAAVNSAKAFGVLFKIVELNTVVHN